ncbi:ATP-binding protein [Streptomyces sp. NPDC005962]|uniref:ATP-binding protein n=1 Tax=Streptomyces sp. NPDC005962 TaxID=3154466 RepID=UPI0033E1E0D0
MSEKPSPHRVLEVCTIREAVNRALKSASLNLSLGTAESDQIRHYITVLIPAVEEMANRRDSGLLPIEGAAISNARVWLQTPRQSDSWQYLARAARDLVHLLDENATSACDAIPGDWRVRQFRWMEVVFTCKARDFGEGLRPEDALRVREMRGLASAWLRDHHLPELFEPVTLAVSELITNALEHGRGESVGFSMGYQDGAVVIRVRDESSERPQRRDTEPLSESGRGIHLVTCIVAEHDGDWGTSPDGTTTWCTFAAPSRA